MIYAVNKNSVLKEVREAIKAADGKKVELSYMQARALYALAQSHKDEVVHFDPDKPLVRDRKRAAKPAEGGELPLAEEPKE